MTVDTITGEVVAIDISVDDARALTDRIKNAAEQVWSLLLEAHERRAWAALGYGRWEDYVRAEFDMARSYSYQVLDHARVVQAIQHASGMSATADILTEREARDIKPILPEVVDKVRLIRDALPQATPDVLAAAVRDVITDARREVQQERDDKAAIAKLNALAPAGFDATADQRRIEQTHAVFDAISAISTAPAPEDFAALVAAQSLYRLDAARTAADWLADLADLLEN